MNPTNYVADSFIIGVNAWWCHHMETFSVLLALCEGNPPITGGVPSQRQVTWSFDVFLDLRLDKWSSMQSRRWWFDTPSRPLWRRCNGHRTFRVAMFKRISKMIQHWKCKGTKLIHEWTLLITGIDCLVVVWQNQCIVSYFCVPKCQYYEL